MKNLLICAAAMLIALAASAQDGPTTTWPYLYPDFTQGTIYLLGGTTVVQDMNVHIRHDRLHYIDKGGVVKEAVLDEVMMVTIGDDRYVNVYGEMMKVIAEGEKKGLVVAEILGDFSALLETGGAYGVSSTTSATRKLSSIETDAQINQPHMLLKQSKTDGQMLNLITNYYIVTSKYRIKATKKDVTASIPKDRQDEWKAWLKKNKIKWNKPGSLVAVADFLSE